jgi:DNA-binding FrmR family transcriptional regulator
MPHSPAEKKRVLARVGRMRGQLEALERALQQGAECAAVLQQIAALRGAVNGLMGQVLESHLREELGQPASSALRRQQRVDEVVALLRSYMK